MLQAAEKWDRHELRECARRRAAGIVQAKRYSVLDPGLFVGLAGIGYELLRLTEPRQLPSVLLWE
jgi:lantibiotic modifying enzyme